MNEEQVRKDSIKSLLNEIQRLKDIIYELEDTIKSKDIIIEALVNQRKMNPEKKKVVRSPQLKEREVKRFKESSSSEDIFKRLPIIGECSVEEQSTPHENDVFSMVLEHTAKSEKTEKPEIVYVKPIIVEQIKAIFSPKTKKQEFKNNFCFFKFIEYCETSYEFNLNNKKISKAKNPLKLYIETNLDKILNI